VPLYGAFQSESGGEELSPQRGMQLSDGDNGVVSSYVVAARWRRTDNRGINEGAIKLHDSLPETVMGGLRLCKM
jgi:hypothetical protein